MASEKSNQYFEELVESIRTTSTLIQTLTRDLKSSEISLATLEIKLQTVSEDVKSITRIVRDGNGSKSIVTRLALIEDDLKDLWDRDDEFRKFVYKKIEELNTTDNIRIVEDKKKKAVKDSKTKYNREKVIGVLKIAPGIIALVAYIIQLLM